MKPEDQERLCGAVRTMAEMQSELEQLSSRTDEEAAERQAELIDDMFTLSMGVGSLRKQLATESAIRENPGP